MAKEPSIFYAGRHRTIPADVYLEKFGYALRDHFKVPTDSEETSSQHNSPN